MKYVLLLFTFSILFNSCGNNKQVKKDMTSNDLSFEENKQKVSKLKNNAADSNQSLNDCEEYWKGRTFSDSLKKAYINEIIKNSKLSENNLRFLNGLKILDQNNLAFKNILAPIFRLSDTEIGLFSFPTYQEVGKTYVDVSKENELLKKFTQQTETNSSNVKKTLFYPMLLDSILNNKPKPTIYYYTTKKIGSTKILELGASQNECLEYYEYSIDATNISLNDKVLFSSPYIIDLVFENNPKIDSLIKKSFRKECMDCPSSGDLERTFARIKGTDNLYFVYADTFPINNKLDTPSRALVLINKRNEVIYLWYEELDLFGCSCL